MKRRAAEVQGTVNGCEVCANPNSKNSTAIIRHVNEGHDARRAAAGQVTQDQVRAHQEYIRQHGGMN